MESPFKNYWWAERVLACMCIFRNHSSWHSCCRFDPHELMGSLSCIVFNHYFVLLQFEGLPET